MPARWNEIADLLVDPVDHTPLTANVDSAELIGGNGRRYPVIDGQPVLLAPDGRSAAGWSFPPVRPGQQADIRARRSLVRRMLGSMKRAIRSGGDTSGAPGTIADRLSNLEVSSASASTILVVGGGSTGLGAEALDRVPNSRLVCFDVYASPATSFVADGHQIPLASSTVDVVWIQAVLEHVAQPQVVVDEISRVLVPGGIVYAETPFLQPVHEGPYDFHRFTHSGHRLLFSAFDELESGPIGGPGALAVLAWRGVVGGVTRSRRAARIAYASGLWLGFIDRVVPIGWRIDFATGTYFLGTKRATAVPFCFDAEQYYEGAQ